MAEMIVLLDFKAEGETRGNGSRFEMICSKSRITIE